MASTDKIIILLDTIFKNGSITHNELKSLGFNKQEINEFVSSGLLKHDKNLRINPFGNQAYFFSDLDVLYERILKLSDAKKQEEFLINLFSLNYNNKDYLLTILRLSYKHKLYDMLFDSVSKLKEFDKEKNNMILLTMLLPYITKIPPRLNCETDIDLPLHIKLDSLYYEGDLPSSISETLSNIIQAINFGINKRKKEILNLILSDNFNELKNYSVDKQMNSKPFDIEVLIYYVNEQILNIQKGISPKRGEINDDSLQALIYSNNFRSALKKYRRMLVSKKMDVDSNPLIVILEKVIKLTNDFMYDDEDERIYNIAKYVSSVDDINLICEEYFLNYEEKVHLILILVKQALNNQNKKFALHLLGLLDSEYIVLTNNNLHVMYQEIMRILHTPSKPDHLLKKN